MTKSNVNKMTKKIIKYGLIKPTKKCNNCERPNHKDNTHCWYCKEDFTR